MNFIIPLFYKLLYMSIIASVIGVTLIAIKKITSKGFSAKYNYLMWIVFIVSLIFPVMIQSRLSIYNVIDLSQVQNMYQYPEEYVYAKSMMESSLSVESQDKVNEGLENQSDTAENAGEITEKAEDAMPEDKSLENTANTKERLMYYAKNMIPYIWFGGLILLIAFYMISYVVFKAKIGKEELVDKRVKEILDKARQDLKVKKDFPLIKQSYIKSPALVGAFHPKILVNEGIQNFSDENLKYIFRHELSHYKRKDNIASLFFILIKIVYWFNPLIWIIIRFIRKDMELAADEIAVKSLNPSERKEYCKLLVYLSSIYDVGFAEKALGIADDKTNLEKRISMVKITDKISKHPILSAFLVFIIIGLVCSILYTNNYYEKDWKEPPKLYIKLEDGTEKEMVITSYQWHYKDEYNNFDMGFESNTYDFTEANTIVIPNATDFLIVTKPGMKIKVLQEHIERLKNGEVSLEGQFNYGNIEKENSIGFWQTNGVYILRFTMYDYKNNQVNYAIRVVSVNGKDVGTLQNLIGTKLENHSNVDSILSAMIMSDYLESKEIVGNTLHLNYQYYPGDKGINGMAMILFTCIDDLENIVFSFSHNKFLDYEYANGENVENRFEILEPITKTRNEVLQENQEESNILKGEY